MVSVPFLPRLRLANEPGQGRGKPPPAGKRSPPPARPPPRSKRPAAPIRGTGPDGTARGHRGRGNPARSDGTGPGIGVAPPAGCGETPRGRALRTRDEGGGGQRGVSGCGVPGLPPVSPSALSGTRGRPRAVSPCGCGDREWGREGTAAERGPRLGGGLRRGPVPFFGMAPRARRGAERGGAISCSEPRRAPTGRRRPAHSGAGRGLRETPDGAGAAPGPGFPTAPKGSRRRGRAGRPVALLSSSSATWTPAIFVSKNPRRASSCTTASRGGGAAGRDWT